MTDSITLNPNTDGSYTLPDGSTLVPSLQLVPPAPPPLVLSPSPPPAPAIKDMVLTLDQPGDIHAGDTFSVTAKFEMSDGTTKPAGYAFSGYNKVIVAPPNSWTRTFKAVGAGTTTITNSSEGFAAHLPVTVLPAASSTPPDPPPANKPPDPPAAPPPPKAAFTATVDGNVVTVQDQTTGATSESLDFGDGTVMDG